MQPTIIPRSGHTISRRDIDPFCLRVLYRLYRAGHQGYLVGGGVRDLLLGIHPKDFDVATDAHPQKVKRLFRNCVLVGRRFRLAHVRFGSTVIEVSTFRRTPDAQQDGEDLLIRQDNTFGTPEDDALRRDFTINALFYDIGTFSLIDYIGGLRDLEDGWIRSIGDPHVRYQEDPVRMLRAAKFAAKLGFDIVDEDLAAIQEHRRRLALASVPRLLEEVYKVLRAGSSAGSFKLLHENDLLVHVLEDVSAHLDRNDAQRDPENAVFYRHLFALDEAILAKEVEPTNSFLLAAVLLPLIGEELERAGLGSTWEVGPEDFEEAFLAAAVPTLRRLTVSRRDGDRLRHVLLMQRRLAEDTSPTRRRERTPPSSRPYFHEAVAVLALGAAVRPELSQSAAAWQEHAAGVEPIEEERQPRRPRRRRPRL